jgi:hypothetical protein
MMKFILGALFLTMAAPAANAKTIFLENEKADAFIARHFPDAAIPGPVRGVFRYVNRRNEVRQGFADCFVPAMGGRSDGFVSTCSVEY